MRADRTPQRDVVLLGGGHAHALVLNELAMRPLEGARLSLIEPNVCAPYTGMLPGFIAGLYERCSLDIDLVKLARRAGARLILGRACGIDPEIKTIHLEGRAPVSFDILSINIGITARPPDLPGFTEFAHSAKPLEAFADCWEKIVASGDMPRSIVILGGGVAGVELALSLARGGFERGPRQVRIVEKNTLLAYVIPRLKRALMQVLAAENIEIIENACPIEITKSAVVLEGGASIPADFVVGAVGAEPYDFLRQSTLANKNGFLITKPDLSMRDYGDIFAVGDCAVIENAPRARAGVYAVRAAPSLAYNLRARLEGTPLRAFRPQKDFLKLISLGQKRAIGALGPVVFSGKTTWHLKDWIDRRFMRRFKPPLLPPAQSARPMLCGGCGAKIGAGVLERALERLNEKGIGDDAALIETPNGVQIQTTDHLRGFVGDPYLMARITALHSLSDIWAMGGQPESALLNITLEEGAEALIARDLDALMAGFAYECKNAGVKIIGGHTTLGAEMSLGMALTGGCSSAPILQSGGQIGDVVILTKPLGIGTILAGEMQAVAPARAVEKAYTLMLQSNAMAAQILSKANAMTDVTGFGLLGHLARLLRASKKSARLRRGAILFLPSAVELAARGIRSSLYSANKEGVLLVGSVNDARDALLYDPQTSGGLLAALAPKAAEEALPRLIGAGYQSAVIGQIEAGGEQGPGQITLW